MKIQIDTTQKVIKLETSENLGELFTAIEQMLPNGLWKEFRLETNTVIEWTSPIIWREVYPIYPQPSTLPYPYPWITCGTSSNDIKLCSGVYSIEC